MPHVETLGHIIFSTLSGGLKQEYDAHTNLPTRGHASTKLPACSPALRTYPPVVQHM
ncbi:hypothetical protein DEO72_LG10g2866 [Vigna unguiculata]|uniref:Uncharacterized protein n=1 Tax=Vigna unguiculata TaxID=3917 RepID=A0A4D6NFD1_VIGUN|nr:hypothetical protein DEO72_LG10g2866 [Vigna unguiculata]